MITLARRPELAPASLRVRPNHAALETILENAPALMVLVDADRRVIKANLSAATFACRPDPEEMVGLLGGDALRCLHALSAPEGCGSGPACQECALRKTVLETLATGLPQHRVRARLEHQTAHGPRTVYCCVSTTPVELRHGRGVAVYIEDVTSATRVKERLKQERAENQMLTANVMAMLIRVNGNGLVTYWNAMAEDLLGIPAAKARGRLLSDCGLPADSPVVRAIEECRASKGGERTLEIPLPEAGGIRWLSINVEWFGRAGFPTAGVVLTGRDITEQRAEEQHHAQSQQLEAIGRLASGIAHEINTPTQYVGDNLRFIREAGRHLQELAVRYRECISQLSPSEATVRLMAQIEAAEKAADLEFLVREMPQAIEQSIEGVRQVARIVRAMKQFAHPGFESMVPTDLNAALETTATVSHNEWKYVADLELERQPDLPPVMCYPGEINQVFLNLIINAAQAIGEVVGQSGTKGRIVLSTRCDGDAVEVRVSDTGPGIPEHIQGRIFEPFFTTKPPGCGTGQGLALAKHMVVTRHKGQIRFETELGKGSAFIVRLPVGNSLEAGVIE